MNTQESTRPERLEKSVEIGTLCAFYGGLLTQRQQEMLRLYYEEDFSLGEIAPVFDATPVMLAYEMTGAAIPDGLRMVVPGDMRGARHIKDVVTLDYR